MWFWWLQLQEILSMFNVCSVCVLLFAGFFQFHVLLVNVVVVVFTSETSFLSLCS